MSRAVNEHENLTNASDKNSSLTDKRRVFIYWLIMNILLLVIAAAIWAWAEYRYVKLYRPAEELRAISEYILYSLPLVVLAANLILLRRLCIWRHLIWSFVTALVVAATWWGLFQTVGVQWHLSLGGTLS